MGKLVPCLILAGLTVLMPPVRAAEPDTSFAYQLLDICQEASAREVDRNGARPTVLSRTMAMWATAVYDAWACYDEKAVGTQFGATLRRPTPERTPENKKKAIAFAGHRILLDVYPLEADYINDAFSKLGYDAKDLSTDPATPQGIGNKVAAAIIEYRHHDGANQCGDEIGGNGKPYSDYTYYQPVNTPEKIIDPDRWMPITFTKPNGEKITPGFLTPHWYRVKTFALKSSNQFRPPAPPKVGSDQMLKEVQENMDFNANLTPERKAIIEFMRDGPRSTGQSGHWLRFAQDVSKRDKNDLDRDVKLYFSVANICFDAFIACWECKRFYDNSRPYWLVRHYFGDKEIKGWGGPGKGQVTLKGSEWHPYSPAMFVTPPFPGYCSGHSTVSAASAKILELFTGSDTFGISVVRTPGELTEQGHEDAKVTLSLPTFTATAEMAGISRVMGGYHVQFDNIEALKLGRKVAEYSWPIYQAYFDGSFKK